MDKTAETRLKYSQTELTKASVNADPFKQFSSWFDDGLAAEIEFLNAMHLATTTKDGRPSSRVVLLKELTANGFVFYTNFQSRKGLELEQNPFAAICFFWPELERQVRAEGFIEKVDEATADKYFKTRPRGSQIGAWTSPQSNIIDSREILEQREQQIQDRYQDKDVPRPAQWGGYVLFPTMVEFWQGRPNRLHDRILYTVTDNDTWTIERLAP